MIFVYILLNFALYYIGKVIFRKKINPISLYSFIWVPMLIAYELKFIYYYNLTLTTWFVIISFQLAYSFGCAIGQLKFNKEKSINNIIVQSDDIYLDLSNKKIRQHLKTVILFLSGISALAIVPNFISLVNNYGIDILQYTNQIYHDRLSGSQGFELIPYLGTIVHLAVILSGVFIARYGVRLFIFIPIILLILNMLPTGGRSDFILAILYLTFPLLLMGKRIKLTKKQIIGLFVAVLSIIVIFSKITNSRSAWVSANSHMSPLMVKLVNINPAFYKIYEYFTIPVGVLNGYLIDPVYSFGINSFGTFISILNKLGANLNYQRYQDGYYTPIYSNVGSYIRELIQDFTYIGGIFVIIIFAFIFGKCFSIQKAKKTFTSEIYVSLFSVIIFMSFFVWFYRETVFWVTTFLGLPIGLYLDKYSRRQLKKSKMP
jgi:oligosaccharide repeat unit polymerase